jgi:hypothetical protein
MATISGTINSVHLLASNNSGRGTRKTYALGCSFGAFTGSADTVDLAAVGATIATNTKNGKTNTLRGGCTGQPGLSDDNTTPDVYGGGTFTVSTDTLAFDLVDAAGGDVDVTAGTLEDVQVIVSVDES